MAKRITQETFDEVVKENIEDFEMQPKQAMEDATKQFISQGVNLSNIDMSGGIGKQEVLAALEVINAFALTGGDQQQFEQALQELWSLCADQYEYSTRNKDIVQSKRGVHTLVDCLGNCEANRTRGKVVETLRMVCRNHIGNRDMFEADGMEALNQILQQQIEDLNLVSRVLRLIHNVCTKAENNKTQFMQRIGPSILVDLVSQRKSASIVRHSCLVMRGLTNPDDLRREISGAMENGRALVSRGVIPLLINVARESLEHVVPRSAETEPDASIPFDEESDNTRPTEVASAAFLALRQLAITSESVNLISAHGGLDLPKMILDADIGDAVTVRAVIGLVRNICADDKYKTAMCQDGTLHAIMRAAVQNFDDPIAVEHTIGTIAAMSLRSPSNVQTIVGLGGVDFILNGIRKHPGSPAIQRQGALCIRNMVGRTPELREAFLDGGAERLLREAGKNLTVVDESYAALRELQCEVSMVRVTEDGVVLPVAEAFGQRPLHFNPVFDETDELNSRINAAAKPPGSNF